MRRRVGCSSLSITALLALATLACSAEQIPENEILSQVRYTEAREICADRNPLRNLYFGDLHAHSALSWDAYGYDLRVTPEQALAFARGEDSVWLPPLDGTGKGTREVLLERPLDFVALTDHSEYFGEVRICSSSDKEGYQSESCRAFREGSTDAVTAWGMRLAAAKNSRLEDVCGADGARCRQVAEEVWTEVIAAAESVSDKSSRCGFTAFVGYEYTSSQQIANQHRNIFFRNAKVPAAPISYYEAPTPWRLWSSLDSSCAAADGCELMSIPHNSNWSNGNLYAPLVNQQIEDQEGTLVPEEEVLKLRARLEPVMEIFQHKGDMECTNGLEGKAAEAACDFEKLRPPPFSDCGEEVGVGGIKDFGCISKYDFARGIFAQGLRRAEGELNAYRPAVIGSTDTHNGTPGNTAERGFVGHVGNSDDTPEKRLSEGNTTHRGRVNNPGGLAAVWALENSRDALWEAMQRRETYATSGPRIALRFFGSTSGYASDLCRREAKEAAEQGYRRGVPMGGVLQGTSRAPSFYLLAQWDAGTAKNPGTPLQQAQIVKGWIDADGITHERVYDVAGEAESGAAVDAATCVQTGAGEETLCAVWKDPDYVQGQRAYYYARVLENPSCRWSTYECNAFPADAKPRGCADTTIEKAIHERAWSSPIWLDSGG